MSDGIIAATARTLRTLADGSVRLSVDFEPMDRARVMELFGEPGSPLAVARLTQEAAQAGLLRNQSIGSGQAQSESQKASAALYGPQAQKLRQSGFFRMPDVWKAIGTDDEFRAWVQRQPSCVSGEWSEWLEEKGEGRCIAAHVRRAGESGTGYKAPYACIPLTDKEHSQCQHQHGESVLYKHHLETWKGHIVSGDSVGFVQEAKEWFDKQRVKYVEQWAWMRAKEILGYEHFNEIHPKILAEWAYKHDLARHLPPEYRV